MTRHDPATAGQHRRAATDAYNARDFARAEAELRALLTLEPHDAWATEVLGRLLMNTGRSRDGAQAYLRLLQLDVPPSVMRRAVDTATRHGLHAFLSEAIERWDLSALEDPCLCDVVLGHPDTAWLASLEGRRVRERDHPQATACLRITLCVRNGNPEPAFQLMDRLLESEATRPALYPLLLRAADYRFRPDLLDRIEGRLLGDLATLPRPSLRQIILCLVDNEQWSLATSLLRKLADQDPGNAWNWRMLARCAQQGRRPDLVLRAWQRLLELSAVTLADARRYQEAIEQSGQRDAMTLGLAQLVDGGADDPEVLIHAYNLARRAGDAELEDSLHARCRESEVAWACLLRATGRFDEAIRVLEATGGTSDIPTWALRALMRIARARGVLERVIALADRHLLRSGMTWVVRQRMEAGLKTWPISRCEREVAAALAVHPDDRSLHRINALLALDARDDPASARDRALAALAGLPDDVHFLTVLGVAHSRLGAHREARAALDRARWLAPRSRTVLCARAQIELADSGITKGLAWINRMLQASGLSPLTARSEGEPLAPQNLCGAPAPMSPHGEKVSVIMTNLGFDPALDSAIDSILTQTHRNLELIIVDDGSDAETVLHLRDRVARDERIQLIELEANQGTYPAKNHGLDVATGAFIAFMDSDDFSHPQRIERQLDALSGCPGAVAVVHECLRVHATGDIEFRGPGSLRMTPISLLIRRSVFERMGYFDRTRVGADSEYVERIAAIFGDGTVLREPLCTMFMSRHDRSLTGGGEFRIDWRSISGTRLAYHARWGEWHRAIRDGRHDGYVDRLPDTRPFPAPAAITLDTPTATGT